MQTSWPIFKEGALDAIPIIISICFLFFSVGVLAYQAHLSCLQSVAMTIVMFAAPLQVVLLQHVNIDQNWLILSILTTTFIVNYRFLLMSAALTVNAKLKCHPASQVERAPFR